MCVTGKQRLGEPAAVRRGPIPQHRRDAELSGEEHGCQPAVLAADVTRTITDRLGGDSRTSLPEVHLGN
ncbi:MAG: hypothetical protein PSX37_08430, partial [bacterium]|nr:hypothetical protein [bacterium]